MRAWSSLFVAAASLSCAAADAALDNKIALINREALLRPGVLEYDNRDSHFLVLPPVGGKFQAKGDANKTEGTVTARSVIDVLLNKRQYCSTGYGYCSSFGRCCPSYDDCCAYGYCIDPEDTCCPNAPCQAGHGCCGQNHCYPDGAVCCGDESYCDAGNHCYKYASLTYDVCCTDSSCTAYVTDGVTVTRTQSYTRTTPPPSTSTTYDYEAYYFTITYYYYYYYWYSVDVSRSVVTSSRSTTRTILSVSATDASDATSSFSDISSTFTGYTPAAATSLESLAGSTATDVPATFGGGGGGSGDSSSPAPTKESTTRTTARGATTTTTTPAGNTAAIAGGASAGTHVSVSDSVLGLWVVVGAAVGALMVAL